jgi:flagellar biosynthesis GTPase FlhF
MTENYSSTVGQNDDPASDSEKDDDTDMDDSKDYQKEEKKGVEDEEEVDEEIDEEGEEIDEEDEEIDEEEEEIDEEEEEIDEEEEEIDEEEEEIDEEEEDLVEWLEMDPEDLLENTQAELESKRANCLNLVFKTQTLFKYDAVCLVKTCPFKKSLIDNKKPNMPVSLFKRLLGITISDVDLVFCEEVNNCNKLT